MADLITRLAAVDEIARIAAHIETVQIAIGGMGRKDSQCDALEVVLIDALRDIEALKERLHIVGVAEQ